MGVERKLCEGGKNAERVFYQRNRVSSKGGRIFFLFTFFTLQSVQFVRGKMSGKTCMFYLDSFLRRNVCNSAHESCAKTEHESTRLHDCTRNSVPKSTILIAKVVKAKALFERLYLVSC